MILTTKDTTPPATHSEGSGIDRVMSEFDNVFFIPEHDEEPCDLRCISIEIETKDFIRQALTTIEKEAYRRGVLSALEKVPEVKIVGGDYMDNDECEQRRGFNACRDQIMESIKELLKV